MSRRNWKRYQPRSLRDALAACKDYALERRNLGVERIAALIGLDDHWTLYKWIANGRMPLVCLPAYENACGAHYATRWLATACDKLVIDMPKGRVVTTPELLDINSSCATALQLLTAFYADPAQADTAATLEALRLHLEQVAYHHHNVAVVATPELEF